MHYAGDGGWLNFESQGCLSYRLSINDNDSISTATFRKVFNNYN